MDGEVPRKILLIEDNPCDALLVEGVLGRSDGQYDVVTAGSLAEATRSSDGREPDLVLSDLALPDGSGLETFELCRSHWPDSPIVILSGTDDEDVAKAAVQAGAQDYLVKGHINPEALRRAVSYAIERHRNAEERRFLVSELEHSRKLEAIGQLAAGVAHEINTPTQYVSDNTRFLADAVADLVLMLNRLCAITESGRSLAADELDKLLAEADVEYLREELPRAVSQSLDGLDHIARIVRAMKEFSHPADDEKVPTDLNMAIETTVTVASNEWKYVADVETLLDPDMPLVPCLPGEVNQVLLNLLVNAAHAVRETVADGEKGRITIETRFGDDAAEIVVTDTGAGIKPEHRDKIFEPFFTTKGVGQGTGQGLAIAHRVIVNRHGGSIECESEVGAGTRFTLTLPRRDRQASAA